ncbi:MAG: HEAT repeat domain-containing protein, partial [Pirellulales bacterium]
TFITQDEDFLTSDHQDFHPTDVLEDADGSVLVVDTGGWYMLCCPTSRQHKPEVLGAIYRVRRVEQQAIDDPRGDAIAWTELDPPQLTRYLGDPRPAVRRRALERLVSQSAVAVPSLAAVVKSGASAEARLQAVWALTRIDYPEARTAARTALADADEQVRQAALHSVALWRDAAALDLVVPLLSEDSLHNRRAAAEGIGRIGNSNAVPALLAAAADYRGRVLDHSLTYALIEIGDAEQIRQGLAADHPHSRRVAMLALDNLAEGNLQPESVIKLLDSDDAQTADAAWWITQRHPEWAGAMAGFFRKQVADPNLAAESLAPLARHLARFSESPQVQQIMAGALSDPD